MAYRRLPKGCRNQDVLLNKLLTPFLAILLPRYVTGRLKKGKAEVRTISLFHPDVLRCSQEDGFQLDRMDLFDLPENRYNVVRAMTVILNWPEDRKIRGIQKMAAAIEENGLLILGQGGGPYPLRCSVFQRNDNRLKFMTDIGHAAYEKQLCLECRI